MDSIKKVLKHFNPFEDKYVSREFQMFGVMLSEKLDDEKHKGMYIKMARDIPRSVLEEALRFVSASNARNRVGLFMWKLKEMGGFKAKVKRQKAKGQVSKSKVKNKKSVEQEGLF